MELTLSPLNRDGVKRHSGRSAQPAANGKPYAHCATPSCPNIASACCHGLCWTCHAKAQVRPAPTGLRR